MHDASFWFLAAVAATFFLAGLVKGVTGMGLPTVAMGILGAMVAPVTAAGLLIVPSFVTNIWQLLAGPAFAAIARRLWSMMAGILLGTLAGSTLLAAGTARWTTAALGAALICYAAYTLFARQLSVPSRVEPWLSPVIGLVTGVITGGTGVFVIPAVPYLQALGFGKEALIQALGLSFTVSTLALAAGLGVRGAFQVEQLGASALAILPALAGMWVGQALRQRVSPLAFRRWFLICLLILGAQLALKPFF